MSIQLSAPPAHSLRLCPDVALTPGRAHEVCGGARRSFALWVAASLSGPVLWVTADWDKTVLHADGVWNILDPARLITLHVQRSEDLLWSVEEALRSGAVPLVVASLPAPPTLTPVRRLHLAAQQGGDLLGKKDMAPLALLLTPGHGGAPGVESRWHMHPRHLPPVSTTPSRARLKADLNSDPHKDTAAAEHHAPPQTDRWQLDRLRARGLPPKSWYVTRPCPADPRLSPLPAQGRFQELAAPATADDTSLPRNETGNTGQTRQQNRANKLTLHHRRGTTLSLISMQNAQPKPDATEDSSENSL